MFNTAEERKAHLDSILNMARSLDERSPCAQLVPMFFGKIDGRNVCASVELPDNNAKEGLLHKIFGMIVEKRLEDGFSMMLESWVTDPKAKLDDMDYNELMKIPGHLRPHTSEKIVVTFVYPEEEFMYMADINVVRGKRVFGEFKEFPGTKEGRFAQIYKMARAALN